MRGARRKGQKEEIRARRKGIKEKERRRRKEVIDS